MQRFVLIKNVGMMINTKDLFEMLVIVSVNLINQAMLESIYTIKIVSAWEN